MTFRSLGRFRRQDRFSFVEALIAILSPLLALFLRGVDFNDPANISPVVTYFLASAGFGTLALAYVQISKSPSGFVSTIDLIKTFKASLIAAVAGVIATFFSTHMQYVPRYVPVIHFFLFSGLITVLNIWRARAHFPIAKILDTSQLKSQSGENQLLLGCGPLSVHYAALIDELPASQKRIAGIVSICGDLVGSTLVNRTILGPVENLKEILAEFRNHGVEIHHIIIAVADYRYQEKALLAVAGAVNEDQIRVSLLTDLLQGGAGNSAFEITNSRHADDEIANSNLNSNVVSSYLVKRQRYDFLVAIALAVMASPVLFVLSALVYFDVGRPIIFWQRRVGRNGDMITVHKFRTLPHLSSELNGDERKPSWIGRLLQIARLDELPQLFDIVEGRVAFIGPRPLLPRDLPAETGSRERVLPGVTGWAQVHGGKSVTADEKIALDHWYLRHASFRLDLLILVKTLRVSLLGQDLRDDRVISEALREYHRHTVNMASFSDIAGTPAHSRPHNDLVENPNAA